MIIMNDDSGWWLRMTMVDDGWHMVGRDSSPFQPAKYLDVAILV